MNSKQLSRDELDSLLTPSAVVMEATDESSARHAAQMRVDNSLEKLHAEFTASLVDILSNLARRDVAVRMTSCVPATFGQFVFGQPIPTCCISVDTRPISSDLFIAIRPSILFSLVDRVMGSSDLEPPQQRPLTEIEREVARFIVNQVLVKYQDAWQPVLSLDFHVDRIEHNAQQLGALAGAEPVFLVRYDVRCGRDQGWLELCLPWNSTHQMRGRLAANSGTFPERNISS